MTPERKGVLCGQHDDFLRVRQISLDLLVVDQVCDDALDLGHRHRHGQSAVVKPSTGQRVRGLGVAAANQGKALKAVLLEPALLARNVDGRLHVFQTETERAAFRLTATAL